MFINHAAVAINCTAIVCFTNDIDIFYDPMTVRHNKIPCE